MIPLTSSITPSKIIDTIPLVDAAEEPSFQSLSILDARKEQLNQLNIDEETSDHDLDYPVAWSVIELVDNWQEITNLLQKPLCNESTIFDFIPSNATTKIIGGFCLFVLEHALKEVFNKLKIAIDFKQYNPNHTYADIDLRFEYPFVSEEAICHYLETCHKVGYNPKKNDISLPQSFVGLFKTKYFKIYKQKYKYEIIGNPESNAHYLHVTIGLFDISYTFSSSIPLFLIDRVQITLEQNDLKLITTKNILLKAVCDIYTKSLYIASPHLANAKAVWKLWHLETKGYRTLDKEGYQVLLKKAFSKLENDKWPSAIDLIKDLNVKHAAQDLSYGYALFIQLYYANLIESDKLNIIKNALGLQKGNPSIFQELMLWKEPIENFFSIFSFVATCGLLIPFEEAPCFQIKHLEEEYICIQDGFSILIPKDKKILFPTLNKECAAVALQLLLRLVPLEKAKSSSIKCSYAFPILEYALDLLEKEDLLSIGFYLCLVVYSTQALKMDSRFIEVIPEFFLTFTKADKQPFALLLIQILQNESNRIIQTDWLSILLNGSYSKDILCLGLSKALKEWKLFYSSTKVLESKVENKNIKATYHEWLILLQQTSQELFESELMVVLENKLLPLEVILSFYEKIASPTINSQKKLYLWLLEYTSYPIAPYENIFYKAIAYLSNQELEKACVYWKRIKKELDSTIYLESLEHLQNQYLNCLHSLVLEEQFEIVIEKLKEQAWLFEELMAYEAYDHLVTSLVDGYYYFDLPKITSIIETLDVKAKRIEHLEVKKQGSIFSLCVIYKSFNEKEYIQLIKNFKKNKERPLLEFLLIKRVIEQIKVKKNILSPELKETISDFLPFSIKIFAPHLTFDLLEFFLEGESLVKALSLLLNTYDIELYKLVQKLDRNDPKLTTAIKAIVREFFTKITYENQAVDTKILFDLFQLFQDDLEEDIIKKVLSILGCSKNRIILNNVKSLIEKKFAKLDLIEAKTNYLNSFLILEEYEEYFKDIRAITDADSFINLFIQRKEALGINAFYRTLAKYKMIETIVPFIHSHELVQDIVVLQKEFNEVATTLFLQNFKNFLIKDYLDVFLEAFFGVDQSLFEDKIFLKKIVENFSLITSLLVENELLKEWVTIVLCIPSEYFPKIIDVAQGHLKKSIIYLTKKSHHTTLKEFIHYLLKVNKVGTPWNKDIIQELTQYFLEQLFIDVGYKNITVTFCRMLPISLVSSLAPLVKKAFADNEADKALIYYYLIANGKHKDALKVDLAAIFSLLAKDCQKAIFAFTFLESCGFFQSEFSYDIIDKSLIISLIAIISEKDFPLSLELIKHSQFVQISFLLKVFTKHNLNLETSCELFIIALKNIETEEDLESFLMLITKITLQGLSYENFLRILFASFETLATLVGKSSSTFHFTEFLQCFFYMWMKFSSNDLFSNRELTLSIFRKFQSYTLASSFIRLHQKQVFIKKMLEIPDSEVLFSDSTQLLKGNSIDLINDESKNIIHYLTMYGFDLYQKKLLKDELSFLFILNEYKKSFHPSFHQLFDYVDSCCSKEVVKTLCELLELHLNQDFSDLIIEDVEKWKKNLFLFFHYFAKDVIEYYGKSICLDKVYNLIKPLGEEFAFKVIHIFEKEIIIKEDIKFSTMCLTQFHMRNNSLNEVKKGATYQQMLYSFNLNKIGDVEPRLFFKKIVEIIQIGFSLSIELKHKLVDELSKEYNRFKLERSRSSELMPPDPESFPNPSNIVIKYFHDQAAEKSSLIAFVEGLIYHLNKDTKDREIILFATFYFIKLLIFAYPINEVYYSILIDLSNSCAIYNAHQKTGIAATVFCHKMFHILEDRRTNSNEPCNFLIHAFNLRWLNFDNLSQKDLIKSFDYFYFSVKNKMDGCLEYDNRAFFLISTLKVLVKKTNPPSEFVKFYFIKGLRLINADSEKRFPFENKQEADQLIVVQKVLDQIYPDCGLIDEYSHFLVNLFDKTVDSYKIQEIIIHLILLINLYLESKSTLNYDLIKKYLYMMTKFFNHHKMMRKDMWTQALNLMNRLMQLKLQQAEKEKLKSLLNLTKTTKKCDILTIKQ